MAGITRQIAEARLTEYLAAEAKVLKNQSYSIGGRSLTRADLEEIREGITYWNGMAAKKRRSGLALKFGTPV